jgi:FkbM family methyltransferase
MKTLFWWFLARVLALGSRLIRRRPSGNTPASWRAVQFSWSQFGEDMVILHLLRDRLQQGRGFYIDVGAFDPVSHSNSYLLYLQGWRGLNVDASPDRLAGFQRARPGDLNIPAAVSNTETDVVFLEYPTAGTSRVARSEDPDRRNICGEEPCAVVPVRTQTLTTLLDRHAPEVREIDFLNIDCEGLDLQVLQGLDWSRWTPRVIAIEANSQDDRETIAAFLEIRGYRLVSQHLVTLIFLHESGSQMVPAMLWPLREHVAQS